MSLSRAWPACDDRVIKLQPRIPAFFRMPPALAKAALLALPLGYLAATHLSFTRQSTVAAALAVALLLVLVVASVQRERRWQAGGIALLFGGPLVVAVALGRAPALPLLLPPVIVPAAVAWMFARSLQRGRTPLIERLARIMHAPDMPHPDVIPYTRRVTLAWALLLSLLALTNLLMIANLSPGGLIELAGLRAPTPVTPVAFARFSNTGTYLMMGVMFIAEFAIRMRRFPDNRFQNPVLFLRHARGRLPQIIEAIRRE